MKRDRLLGLSLFFTREECQSIRILAIDPSLNNVGYAVIESDKTGKLELIKYGIYELYQADKAEQKMLISYETTRRLIRENNVDTAAFEIAYHNPKRAKGGAIVREIVGILKLAMFQEGATARSYTPQTIKKAVTGRGDADKTLVARKVAELFGIERFVILKRLRRKQETFTLTPEELFAKGLDHVADAMAIGVCRARDTETKDKEA